MLTRDKTVVHARLNGKAESHSRTKLMVRDLTGISDEPESRGGSNQGFAPTELLIAALVSCTNVISHKIAGQHGIEILELDISADYALDRRGVMLQEEVDVPFPQIRLTIQITTAAADSDIAIIERDLPRYCAVSKVIAESGTSLITEWVVIRPDGRQTRA